MKLRTKATLLFAILIVFIGTFVSLYSQYIIGDVFKKQAINNAQIIAEQSEGAYFAFLGTMRVRANDWTSDSALRAIVKSIIESKDGTALHKKNTDEFASYMRYKKMPYDNTIFRSDLINKKGVVIASTDTSSIGEDLSAETIGGRSVHKTDETMNSKFGDVFFGAIETSSQHRAGPVTSVSVRFFEPSIGSAPTPLDVGLVIYFSNISQISDAIGTSVSAYAPKQRQTSGALRENYKTSDIYLVNNEETLVTPSRYSKDTETSQKVDTFPVRECLDNGREISGEYDSFNGKRVIGASMCSKEDSIVIVAEILKDEIYAPMTTLIQLSILLTLFGSIIGIMIIALLARKPLKNIASIIAVAQQISRGNIYTQVKVDSKDEIGDFASVFNKMIVSIQDSQHKLREDKYITEREKVKDEALLASLGEGMIAADKSGKIISMNHVAEQLLGISQTEATGKSVLEMVEALDEAGNEIPNELRPITLAMSGVSTSVALQYRKKNDGYFPVFATVTPVILEGEVIGVVDIFRDITSEKEIEKTRDDLLSLASHQLRTPLSGTKWLIETLKKGIHGPLTAPQAEYLDEIYKINERMTELVHDMLGVIRMESSGSKASIEKVSVRSIIETPLDALHGAAKSKQITISVEGSLDTEIETDPVLFRNIIENLISNAINYSPSKSKVAVRVERANDDLVIAIEDFGIGIPKDEQKRIFERFYRASNAKTFDTHGTGLGLYIASILAKKIGGKLSFESSDGKGSTFFMRLPAHS